MPSKQRKRQQALTEYEWNNLPITLSIDDMARACCTSRRWVSDHAAELGGRKIAGRWMFPKSETAKLLGIGG
jgi:hypothetical protein